MLPFIASIIALTSVGDACHVNTLEGVDKEVDDEGKAPSILDACDDNDPVPENLVD